MAALKRLPARYAQHENPMTPRPVPRTPFTRRLGRTVRLLRQSQTLSQRSLARRAGVSGTTVLRLERGDAVLLPHVQAILRALGYELALTEVSK